MEPSSSLEKADIIDDSVSYGKEESTSPEGAIIIWSLYKIFT